MNEPTVFVVDDDPAVRDSLAMLMTSIGLAVETFDTAKDAQERAGAALDAQLSERVAALTPREREVMALVVEGKASKVIGIELDMSERTVEFHRSRIMKKMGARTLPDLVRMVSS